MDENWQQSLSSILERTRANLGNSRASGTAGRTYGAGSTTPSSIGRSPIAGSATLSPSQNPQSYLSTTAAKRSSSPSTAARTGYSSPSVGAYSSALSGGTSTATTIQQQQQQQRYPSTERARPSTASSAITGPSTRSTPMSRGESPARTASTPLDVEAERQRAQLRALKEEFDKFREQVQMDLESRTSFIHKWTKRFKEELLADIGATEIKLRREFKESEEPLINKVSGLEVSVQQEKHMVEDFLQTHKSRLNELSRVTDECRRIAGRFDMLEKEQSKVRLEMDVKFEKHTEILVQDINSVLSKREEVERKLASDISNLSVENSNSLDGFYKQLLHVDQALTTKMQQVESSMHKQLNVVNSKVEGQGELILDVGEKVLQERDVVAGLEQHVKGVDSSVFALQAQVKVLQTENETLRDEMREMNTRLSDAVSRVTKTQSEDSRAVRDTLADINARASITESTCKDISKEFDSVRGQVTGLGSFVEERLAVRAQAHTQLSQQVDDQILDLRRELSMAIKASSAQSEERTTKIGSELRALDNRMSDALDASRSELNKLSRAVDGLSSELSTVPAPVERRLRECDARVDQAARSAQQQHDKLVDRIGELAVRLTEEAASRNSQIDSISAKLAEQREALKSIPRGPSVEFVEQTKHDLANITADQTDLSRALDSLRSELQTSIAKLSAEAVPKAISPISEAVGRLQQEVQDLQAAQESQESMLSRQMQEQSNNIVELKKVVVMADDETRKSLLALEANEQSVADTVARIESDIDTLKSQLVELAAVGSHANTDVAASMEELRTAVEQMESEVEAAKKDLSAVEMSVENAEGRLSGLEDNVRELFSAGEATHTILEKHSAGFLRVEEIAQAIAEQDQRLETMVSSEELMAVNKRVEELAAEIDAVKSKPESVDSTEDLQRVSDALAALGAELTALGESSNASSAETAAAVEELRTAVEHMQLDVEMVKRDCSTVDGSIENIEKHTASLDTSVRELFEAGEATHSVLQKHAAGFERVEGIAQDINQRLEVLERQDLSSVGERMDDLAHQITALTKEVRSKPESVDSTQVDRLSAEVAALRDAAAAAQGAPDLDRDLKDVRASLARLQEDMAHVPTTADVQSISERLDALVEDLTAQIDEANGSAVSAKSFAETEVGMLQTRMEDLEQSAANARSELDSKLAELAAQPSHAEPKQAQEAALACRIDALDEEVKHLVSENDDRKNDVSSLAKDVAALRSDVEENLTKLSSDMSALKPDTESADQMAADIQTLRDSVSAELDQIYKRQDGTDQAVFAAQGEVADLKLQVEKLVEGQRDESELSAKIDELSQQMATLGEGKGDRRDEEEPALESMQKEVASVRDVCRQTADKMEGVVKDTAAQREAVEQLEQSVAEQKKAREEADRVANMLHAQLSAFKEQVLSQLKAFASDDELREVQQSAEDLQDQIDALASKSELIDQSASNLRTELSDLIAATSTQTESEVANLKSQVEKLVLSVEKSSIDSAKVDELSQQVSALGTAAAAVPQTSADVDHKLEDVLTAVERIDQQLREIEGRIQTESECVQSDFATKEEVHLLSERVSEVEEPNVLGARVEEIAELVEGLKSRLTEAEKSLSDTKRTDQSGTDDIAELRQQVHALDTEVQKVQSEIAAARGAEERATALEQRVGGIEQELTALDDKIDSEVAKVREETESVADNVRVLNASAQESEALKSQVASLAEQVSAQKDLHTRVEDLQASVHELAESQQRALEEVSSRLTNSVSEDQVAGLVDQLAALKKDSESKITDILAQLSAVSDAAAEREATEHQTVSALKQQLSDLSQTVQQNAGGLDRVAAQISELAQHRPTDDSVSPQVEKIGLEVENLKLANEKIAQSVSELAKRCDEMKQEHQVAQPSPANSSQPEQPAADSTLQLKTSSKKENAAAVKLGFAQNASVEQVMAVQCAQGTSGFSKAKELLIAQVEGGESGEAYDESPCPPNEQVSSELEAPQPISLKLDGGRQEVSGVKLGFAQNASVEQVMAAQSAPSTCSLFKKAKGMLIARVEGHESGEAQQPEEEEEEDEQSEREEDGPTEAQHVPYTPTSVTASDGSFRQLLSETPVHQPQLSDESMSDEIDQSRQDESFERHAEDDEHEELPSEPVVLKSANRSQDVSGVKLGLYSNVNVDDVMAVQTGMGSSRLMSGVFAKAKERLLFKIEGEEMGEAEQVDSIPTETVETAELEDQPVSPADDHTMEEQPEHITSVPSLIEEPSSLQPALVDDEAPTDQSFESEQQSVGHNDEVPQQPASPARQSTDAPVLNDSFEHSEAALASHDEPMSPTNDRDLSGDVDRTLEALPTEQAEQPKGEVEHQLDDSFELSGRDIMLSSPQYALTNANQHPDESYELSPDHSSTHSVDDLEIDEFPTRDEVLVSPASSVEDHQEVEESKVDQSALNDSLEQQAGREQALLAELDNIEGEKRDADESSLEALEASPQKAANELSTLSEQPEREVDQNYHNEDSEHGADIPQSGATGDDLSPSEPESVETPNVPELEEEQQDSSLLRDNSYDDVPFLPSPQQSPVQSALSPQPSPAKDSFLENDESTTEEPELEFRQKFELSSPEHAQQQTLAAQRYGQQMQEEEEEEEETEDHVDGTLNEEATRDSQHEQSPLLSPLSPSSPIIGTRSRPTMPTVLSNDSFSLSEDESENGDDERPQRQAVDDVRQSTVSLSVSSSESDESDGEEEEMEPEEPLQPVAQTTELEQSSAVDLTEPESPTTAREFEQSGLVEPELPTAVSRDRDEDESSEESDSELPLPEVVAPSKPFEQQTSPNTAVGGELDAQQQFEVSDDDEHDGDEGEISFEPKSPLARHQDDVLSPSGKSERSDLSLDRSLSDEESVPSPTVMSPTTAPATVVVEPVREVEHEVSDAEEHELAEAEPESPIGGSNADRESLEGSDFLLPRDHLVDTGLEDDEDDEISPPATPKELVPSPQHQPAIAAADPEPIQHELSDEEEPEVEPELPMSPAAAVGGRGDDAVSSPSARSDRSPSPPLDRSEHEHEEPLEFESPVKLPAVPPADSPQQQQQALAPSEPTEVPLALSDGEREDDKSDLEPASPIGGGAVHHQEELSEPEAEGDFYNPLPRAHLDDTGLSDSDEFESSQEKARDLELSEDEEENDEFELPGMQSPAAKQTTAPTNPTAPSVPVRLDDSSESEGEQEVPVSMRFDPPKPVASKAPLATLGRTFGSMTDEAVDLSSDEGSEDEKPIVTPTSTNSSSLPVLRGAGLRGQPLPPLERPAALSRSVERDEFSDDDEEETWDAKKGKLAAAPAFAQSPVVVEAAPKATQPQSTDLLSPASKPSRDGGSSEEENSDFDEFDYDDFMGGGGGRTSGRGGLSSTEPSPANNADRFRISTNSDDLASPISKFNQQQKEVEQKQATGGQITAPAGSGVFRPTTIAFDLPSDDEDEFSFSDASASTTPATTPQAKRIL